MLTYALGVTGPFAPSLSVPFNALHIRRKGEGQREGKLKREVAPLARYSLE